MSAGREEVANRVNIVVAKRIPRKGLLRVSDIATSGVFLITGVSGRSLSTSPMRGGIMSVKMASDVLLLCGAINFGLLLWWFLFFTLAHDWSYRITGRWFRLSVEQFDAMNYIGMALYKIGILLFNLVPYIALRIIG
jgi:hypothetical protein